ncbi:MAG TPA: hypothetical protein VNP04_13525 [Alphaproteobacteria bacterium]|nr:hypothetical protein [Alphaproteobacteria bacterium]
MPAGKYMGAELSRELIIHIGEHEAHLAFNSDADAAYFHEWWEEHGEQAFSTWREKQSHYDS